MGGAPRSGTSLVQSMMNSHPDIYGGPEFDRVPDIVHLRNKLQDSVLSGRIDSFCNADEIDVAIGGLIETLLLPVANSRGADWLCEKTPVNVLAFQQLLEILPEARFIHVVRHPLAVFASLDRVRQRHIERALCPPALLSDSKQIMATIIQYVTAGVRAQQREAERVYTIHYERLVQDTITETRLLCDFLHIEWAEAMLHPGRHAHTAEELLRKDNGLWTGNRRGFTDPDTSSLTRWQADLDSSKVQELRDIFSTFPAFRELGYDLTAASTVQTTAAQTEVEAT